MSRTANALRCSGARRSHAPARARRKAARRVTENAMHAVIEQEMSAKEGAAMPPAHARRGFPFSLSAASCRSTTVRLPAERHARDAVDIFIALQDGLLVIDAAAYFFIFEVAMLFQPLFHAARHHARWSSAYTPPSFAPGARQTRWRPEVMSPPRAAILNDRCRARGKPGKDDYRDAAPPAAATMFWANPRPITADFFSGACFRFFIS